MEYMENGIIWVLPEDFSMETLIRITLIPNKVARHDTLDRLATSKRSKEEAVGN